MRRVPWVYPDLVLVLLAFVSLMSYYWSDGSVSAYQRTALIFLFMCFLTLLRILWELKQNKPRGSSCQDDRAN